MIIYINYKIIMKNYIKVPFSEKEEVKQLGAKWDKEMKSWYVPEEAEQSKFSKWQSYDPSTAPAIDPNATRVYLAVPFDEKDAVKSAGGRWDGEKRQWYHLSNVDPSPFSKWKTSQNNESSGQKQIKKSPPKINQQPDLSDELDDILKFGDE
jgi:hypothetical protein